MFDVDLHTHTRFFHGSDRLGELFDPVGVRLLAGMARRRDLDGIALTNHDYYRELGRPIHADRRPKTPTVVPGIEVSTTRGHVLVVGPDPPARVETGALTPGEVVELAHDRGCAAIIPHPYRDSTVREVDESFDAIEVNGKHPRTERWVRRLARRHDLPLVGGSDAHYPVEVGRASTLVDAETLTPESLVEAIRDGHVEPTIRRGAVDRVVRGLYWASHRAKGHLHRPEEDAPGVGEPPRGSEREG